jgi:CBS domain-containing protein
MARIICPDCGHENLAGADECVRCHQPLTQEETFVPQNELERSVAYDHIGRLDIRDPVCVSPETPVGEVLRRMVAARTGCALVMEGAQLVGIFTERDALLRLSLDRAEWEHKPVRYFMTSPVETLELEDRLAFAIHRMAVGGYRHIPILSDGQVVGVVSVREVFRHLTRLLEAG